MPDPHIITHLVPCPGIEWTESPKGPKPYRVVVNRKCVEVEEVIRWLQRINLDDLSDRFLEATKIEPVEEISIASENSQTSSS